MRTMETIKRPNSFSTDRGYFVGSDDDEYFDVISETEPYERYVEGLYYPTCIGEIFLQKYSIVHKLGHGGFSTVWLAFDMQNKLNVALKIHIPGDKGVYEYTMNNEIDRCVQDTSNLLTCFDRFYIYGLQGEKYVRHLVMVFPLRGLNFASCEYDAPRDTRISAVRQVLEGLKHLHDSGIMHRDKPTIYKHLGRPQKEPLELWKRGELVRPIKIPAKFIGQKAYIGDFGLAIRSGTLVDYKVQFPVEYCAPERFHGMEPSFASDMWSYMVIFTEVWLGFNPFSTAGNSIPRMVSRLVNVLGPLPAEWRGSYHDGYLEDGDRSDYSWYDQSRKLIPSQTLEAMVGRSPQAKTLPEQQQALALIHKGLSYLPQHRPTATELLSNSLFLSVMSYYRT